MRPLELVVLAFLAMVALLLLGTAPSLERERAWNGMGEHIRACDRDEDRCVKVARFYQERCDDKHDGEACWCLGFLYRRGRGVERDPQRAAELMRRGCTYGEALACRDGQP